MASRAREFEADSGVALETLSDELKSKLEVDERLRAEQRQQQQLRISQNRKAEKKKHRQQLKTRKQQKLQQADINVTMEEEGHCTLMRPEDMKRTSS